MCVCCWVLLGATGCCLLLPDKIPAELVKMAEAFQSKVDSGEARKASSGFAGKGFTFDDSEQSESQQVSEVRRSVG